MWLEEYHVGDVVQASNPLNIRISNARSSEDGGSIDGDTCNANPLLHDLEPDYELDTTAIVECPRTDTEKHGKV